MTRPVDPRISRNLGGSVGGPPTKVHALAALAQRVRSCRRCPGLNIASETESAPGYGNPDSPVVIVGQSLCGPCMKSQIPFTGGSGKLVDQALEAAGLRKNEVFITNVVHCHPPDNRPSLPHEVSNCSEYLRAELETIRPRLVIGLGKDAAQWLQEWVGPNASQWTPSTPTAQSSNTPLFLPVYHPAYIRRRPAVERDRYIEKLTQALRWAFSAQSGPRSKP